MKINILFKLSLFERERTKEKQQTCDLIAFVLWGWVQFERLQEPARTSTSCALRAGGFGTHLLSVGENPFGANIFMFARSRNPPTDKRCVPEVLAERAHDVLVRAGSCRRSNHAKWHRAKRGQAARRLLHLFLKKDTNTLRITNIPVSSLLTFFFSQRRK